MIEKKVYFKNLDSIRFFAALMVFLGHAISPAFDFLPIQGTFVQRFLLAISNGPAGVSIFFVLSGFLITYLLISEYKSTSGISIKNFYIRRILRIWPLYFIVVLITFGIYPGLKELVHLNTPLGSNVLYHLLFLSNFDVINIHENCFGFDAMSQNITWSVSIEEQFYLFWPLLFAFLPKRSWIIGILTVIFISMLFRWLKFDDHAILYFHTLSVFVDLGIGGLFALLIHKHEVIRKWFEQSKTPHLAISLSVAAIFILYGEDIFFFAHGKAISRFFISISFAMVIATQALTTSDSKLNMHKLGFASRWGKYTYGIYLLHPIAITVLDVCSRVMSIPKDNFWIIILLGILSWILTLWMSWLSFEKIEKKFLTLKDRYSTIQTHN